MKYNLDDPAQIVIEFTRWEVFTTLKHRIVIPRAAITNIEWTPELVYEEGWLFRWAGTGLPGALYAGTFRKFGRNAARYFLFVVAPKTRSWLFGTPFTAHEVMTITTTDFGYQKLLLSMPQPGYAKVRDWWQKGVSAK